MVNLKHGALDSVESMLDEFNKVISNIEDKHMAEAAKCLEIGYKLGMYIDTIRDVSVKNYARLMMTHNLERHLSGSEVYV